MSAWLLAALAAGVFALRAFRRKLSRAEIVVAAYFAVHFLLIQGLVQWQSAFCEGVFVIDPRYHVPTVPLLFGLAAVPLVALGRRLRFGRLVVVALVAALAVNCVYEFVCRQKDRRDLYEIAAWGAEQVRKDWDGPRFDEPVFDPYFYRPVNRPMIESVSPGAAYFAGGRLTRNDKNWWNMPRATWVEAPDYFLMVSALRDHPTYAGAAQVYEGPEYELVATRKAGRSNEYRLYRKRANR